MPCLLVFTKSGQTFHAVSELCSSIGWSCCASTFVRATEDACVSKASLFGEASETVENDDAAGEDNKFDAVLVDLVDAKDGVEDMIREVGERSAFMPLILLTDEPAPPQEFGDGLRYYVTPSQLVDLEHIMISLTCGFTTSFMSPSSRHSRVPRVLIVDDNLELANMIERSLRALERYDVRVTGSGYEAASILPSFFPDVVVIDLVLNDMDGREVCSFIRNNAQLEKTRIIGVSGYLPEGCASEKQGLFDVYLEKPFRVKDVVEQIENLVQK